MTAAVSKLPLLITIPLKSLNILLADDDSDDRLFFKKALEELQLSAHLTTVNDGEQLMDYLHKNSGQLPDVLFLDISMPRKTGIECLAEIKEDEILKNLKVIMFSTSFPRDSNYENEMISLYLNLGAHQFIRKPPEFALHKKVIHQSLIKLAENETLPYEK
jgi:CheY-like chemotaxis protein